MSRLSIDEIGLRLHNAGVLDRFEKAIAADDHMSVVNMLMEVGVGDEIISRMLLELDKNYLLEVASSGRAAATG